MNKYKTQETACYTFISMWVIGILILMITSCSASQYTMKKKTYDNKTGLYHQKNTYEPWSIK